MNEKEMTLEEALDENANLRTQIANLELLLTEAKESGKAARKLAREAMRANDVEGAHVVLKASPRGLQMVVCAPPAGNEEALAKQIAQWMNRLCGDLKAGEPQGQIGVSES